MCLLFSYLTLVAQHASPAGLTVALPGSSAAAVLAARVCVALVTILAPPSYLASAIIIRNKTQTAEVHVHEVCMLVETRSGFTLWFCSIDNRSHELTLPTLSGFTTISMFPVAALSADCWKEKTIC